MKNLILFMSLVFSFSSEKIGEADFVAKENVKLNLVQNSTKIESSIGIKESKKTNIELENGSFLFSLKNQNEKISFGIGNFDKTYLSFQKTENQFTYFSSLLSSKIKSQDFLKLPDISSSSQPFGFGIFYSKNDFTYGLSFFNPKKDEEFCFFNIGFRKQLETARSKNIFTFQGTFGYSTFSQKQSKNSWFSDKKYFPQTKMPQFIGNINYEHKTFQFNFEGNSEVKIVDSPIDSVKFLFTEELKFGFQNFALNLGLIYSSINFPLLSNSFSNQDLSLKFQPEIKCKNSTFSISFIGNRIYQENMESYFFTDFGFLFDFSFENKKIQLKIEEQDILVIPLSFQTQKFDIIDFINLESKTKIDLGLKFSHFEFDFSCNLQSFSDFHFWQNPENQFNLKIGFDGNLGTEKILKLESNVKINYKKNSFYSEVFFMGVEFEKIKLKFDLEFVNQFLKKNAEKSGINLGISGTINL